MLAHVNSTVAGFSTTIVVSGSPITVHSFLSNSSGPYTFPMHSLSIIIPSSVKVIDEDAFTSCINLQEVIFEGKVEGIEENAFGLTDSLFAITIPGKTGLGDYVFRESSLEIVHYKGTVEDFYINGFDYGMYTFADTDVPHITCTDGVIDL
jgi:hypothetical protein